MKRSHRHTLSARLVVLIMSVAMVLTMTPAFAFANDSGQSGDTNTPATQTTADKTAGGSESTNEGGTGSLNLPEPTISKTVTKDKNSYDYKLALDVTAQAVSNEKPA